MRASVLSRARNGGLMYMDGGLSEERKNQWLTARISRADVKLMREMYDSGHWNINRISKMFGLGWQGARDICHRLKYLEDAPRPQAGLSRR